MARKATDTLKSRRAIAESLGVHIMSVTRWERDGMPVAKRGGRGRPSLYDEVAVRAWKAARDESHQTEPVDLVRERARKEHWQAQLAEQQFLVRAGKLIAVDDAARAWTSVVSAVRSKLLTLPMGLADRVCRAAVTDGPAAVESIIRMAVHDALRELSSEQAPAPPTRQSRRREKGSKSKRRKR